MMTWDGLELLDAGKTTPGMNSGKNKGSGTGHKAPVLGHQPGTNDLWGKHPYNRIHLAYGRPPVNG